MNADNEVLLQQKFVFNPDTAFAVIDANANHIIIRPLPIHSLTNQLVDRLCNNQFNVQGFVNNEDKSTLSAALTTCVLNDLPLQQLITVDDMKKILQTKETYSRHKNLKTCSEIQVQYNAQFPIPASCWYDGEFYMDFHGTKSHIRPDILKLIQHYSDIQNKQMKKYNELLVEAQEFM